MALAQVMANPAEAALVPHRAGRIAKAIHTLRLRETTSR